MGRAKDAGGEGVENDAAGDGSPRARLVAWGAIMLLGCTFSYSLGWQKGWINGTNGVNVRLSEMNRILLGIQTDADGAPGSGVPGSGAPGPSDATAGSPQLPQASL